MENFCSQASLFLVFEIFNMIFPLLGQQGITEVLSIIDGQHQQWSNGMELLEEAQQNKIILPTGCERYPEPEDQVLAMVIVSARCHQNNNSISF